MHENIFMHENDIFIIFMHENEMSMHENDGFAQNISWDDYGLCIIPYMEF